MQTNLIINDKEQARFYADLIAFIREQFGTESTIPLHAPQFNGNEKRYVNETIDSTFVSSVGGYVNQFEQALADYTGSVGVVATVNGTTALHTALYLSDVKAGDLVITQALTFVATCNAITQLGAEPLFVDVSSEGYGLCPSALGNFLSSHAAVNDRGECYHKASGRRIQAVVPMHTFGHPVAIDKIATLCEQWRINLVEDAAESLGSFYRQKHTGTFGRFGVLSFNGNKIITAGGGGAVLCQQSEDVARAKHITTTAKVPHAWAFHHDELGFNYRMPNLNAALACAQLEQLDIFIQRKRALAGRYQCFFSNTHYKFVHETQQSRSNYWLNTILCPDKYSRDALLSITNEHSVMTRPAWQLMNTLPMFQHCICGDLSVSEMAVDRLLNLPSSVTSL